MVQITMNFFVSVSMSFFFGMLEALQMVVFQMMFNLNYPANVQMVMNLIL